MSNEITTVAELVQAVSSFFPKVQLKIIKEVIDYTNDDDWEENCACFVNTLQKFKIIFDNMPKTYETEHIEAKDKVVHLHYFVGGCDWWIVEKDIEEEQHQAFGVVKMGNNAPEFGYISIVELIEFQSIVQSVYPISVELDFHWEPTKLKDIPELAGMLK